MLVEQGRLILRERLCRLALDWLVASTDGRVNSGRSLCGDGVGTPVVPSPHSSFCSFTRHFQPSTAHPTRSSSTPERSLRHVEPQ